MWKALVLTVVAAAMGCTRTDPAVDEGPLRKGSFALIRSGAWDVDGPGAPPRISFEEMRANRTDWYRLSIDNTPTLIGSYDSGAGFTGHHGVIGTRIPECVLIVAQWKEPCGWPAKPAFFCVVDSSSEVKGFACFDNMSVEIWQDGPRWALDLFAPLEEFSLEPVLTPIESAILYGRMDFEPGAVPEGAALNLIREILGTVDGRKRPVLEMTYSETEEAYVYPRVSEAETLAETTDLIRRLKTAAAAVAPGKARLDLSYDDERHELTIVFHSPGEGLLCLDRELVWGIEISVEQDNQVLAPTWVRGVAAPGPEEMRRRFDIIPAGGGRRVRVVNLKDGFKVFTWGHSEAPHALIAASEGILAYPTLTHPSRITVRFGKPSSMSFDRCFEAYTGRPWDLFDGPVVKTIKIPPVGPPRRQSTRTRE